MSKSPKSLMHLFNSFHLLQMMFEDAFMVVCLSKLIKVPLAEMQVSKLIVKVKLLFSLVRYKYLVRN